MDGNSQSALDRSKSQNKFARPQAGASGSIMETDVKLVVGMVMGSLFHGNGIQQIVQMVQKAGQNAPQAVAHAILTGVVQARHMLEQNNMPVDNKVWVAPGGVVQQLVVEVCKILASTLGQQFLSKDFMSATSQTIIQAMQQQDKSQQAAPTDEAEPMEESPEAEAQEGQGLMAPTGGM